jgi:hypothetical protein
MRIRKNKANTSAMSLPIVFLSKEYFFASSKALLAKPTAPEATGGLVKSNAPMAILKPAPSAPRTFYTNYFNSLPYVLF